MMIDELGMLEDDRSPTTSGIITFLAFLFAGTVPLLVYIAGFFLPLAGDQAFAISVLLSGIALFGLGAGKVFVTHQNPIRSGLEMLLVGGLAAGVAYAVGALLRSLGL
jgi:VIT1/CCC1 family predicted Fe2+/Mn2+ transporter